MKEGIHPNYVAATVVCACGNTFQTRSTKQSIRLEICSNCHPYFTGKQKFVDSAGRVERFQKRFANAAAEPTKKAPAAKLAKGQSAAMSRKKVKILSSAPISIPVKTRGPKPAGKTSGESRPGAAPKSPTPKAAH